VSWLSQPAGAAAIADLREMATDERDEHEVRVMALFALSRLPGDEGFTALLDIARSSDDPDLRRHAMFWLGQTGDPRALAFFEEVLARQ
jgi:HEAT repeat protein